MVTTHYNFYVARTCPLILTGAWLLILPMVNTGDILVSLLTAGQCRAPIIAPVVSRHASHCTQCKDT